MARKPKFNYIPYAIKILCINKYLFRRNLAVAIRVFTHLRNKCPFELIFDL